jgi:hypothetical protein
MQAGTSYVASSPPLDISPPSLLFLLLELVLPSSLVVFSPCSCPVCSAEILACVWVQSPSEVSTTGACASTITTAALEKYLTDSLDHHTPYQALALAFAALRYCHPQLLNLSFSGRRLYIFCCSSNCSKLHHLLLCLASASASASAPASALQHMTSRAAILFLLELSSSTSSSASLPQSSLVAVAPR